VVLDHHLLYGHGAMTLITFQNGGPLFKGSKVATQHECCCPSLDRGCCIVGGAYDPAYTTKASCEECTIIDYDCYEQLQTECDGTCPDGATAMPDLVSLEFSGCFGSGGTASVSIGCGEILSATVTNGGSGYALPGRAAPTLTASVGGTGSGASLSVTLAQEQDGCGVDYWRVASLSVTAAGSGYTAGDPITFSLGSGDTQADKAVANVTVGGSGDVTGATVFNGGAYYHEDNTLAAYVDSVVVSVVQESPSNGVGEAITATVEDDPADPDFGKVVGLTVTAGGSGFAQLCERTTQVESCDDCPTLSAPESSTCTANTEGPCGTWTDPCPCGGEEMCVTLLYSETPDTNGDGNNCNPEGPYGAQTVEIPASCLGPVEVTITGIQDDEILIDGESVSGACNGGNPGDGNVNYSFITTADSFTVSAMNNWAGPVGYDLTICFAYPTEEPPP
jgi:hypothetical protein